MYDYIKGQLTKITAKYIVVESNGLGYIINVANPYSFTERCFSEINFCIRHWSDNSSRYCGS